MPETMEISLINLDRCSDRLAKFHSTNAHLTAISRVAALEGARFSRDVLIRNNILANPMPEYTNGAIGCALSHLSLWELAVREKKMLTVAEDDAIFHNDFDSLAKEVIDTLPPEWDIVLWGWNFDSFLLFDMLPGASSCLAQFDQAKLRTGISTYQKSDISPKAYRLMRAFGTICYSISPAGAERLHNHCVPIRPMNTFYPGLNRSLVNIGIDRMMNEAYPSLSAFVCFPPLVATENDNGASTTLTAG